MSTDAVDWDIAKKFAYKTAGHDPYRAQHYRDGLEQDFDRYTAQAEALVEQCTGLRSLSGNARGRVTGRQGWIDANLASFRRLLRPVVAKLGEHLNEGAMRGLGGKIAGAELGVMLGWMSKRVLGQYDLLVIEDEHPEEQDIVYYVAPNVLSLEQRYAFPPQEFRLWLALHEVTHRAQFTGVPWMRQHFLGLVESTMEELDPDPKRLMEAVSRVVEARRRGEDALAQGGVMGLFASEQQLEVINEVAGLMSLLEGHGDVTMDRAGLGLVPSAPRFARVLRNRRQNVRGVARVFQKISGLEAKMKQYAEGEHFIAVVENHGGAQLLDRAWAEPANVPSIKEIRQPELWIARVAPADIAA